MEYILDRRINLTALYNDHYGNFREIRNTLMHQGLVFVEAHQFAMFACFGFHGPTEKQTLSHTNALRLAVLAN